MQKSEQVTNLYVPGDSEGDEEETTQDEVSSHTSEEDGGVVKVEKELENTEQPVGGNEVPEHEASDNGSQAQEAWATVMVLPLVASWAFMWSLSSFTAPFIQTSHTTPTSDLPTFLSDFIT